MNNKNVPHKPILEFLKIWSSVLIISFVAQYIVSIIFNHSFDWYQFLYYLLLWFFALISFIMSYIIAYKTKIFPSINNRKAILIPTTFIFSFIFITILILLPEIL